MKLEDQVCSLENAKRLEELGIRKVGLFQWINFGKGEIPTIVAWNHRMFGSDYVHAPTVAELGEMLPWYVNTHHPAEAVWKSFCEPDKAGGYWVTGKTEADARAKMLIWLLENGHVNAEDLNNEG